MSTTRGTVSSGLRWADPTRTDIPEDLLRGEGIQMPGNIADPAQRLTRTDLRDLLGSNV
ncbi:hypothetical protein [Kibdelosporangium phytohabitans]|uniref:hypothetical protein n=1 Tax=Kibdelosporangium phytohabitans TaxID=860235 RepID=UPI0014705D15|nr:hypothetical protein [Kibdelosporangium phytohabitans]MBE1470708.1 hypothetical protein [Kibdelosporangium phytohabitans]